MKKKPSPTDDDLDIFYSAMKGATRYQHKKTMLRPPPPSKRTGRPAIDPGKPLTLTDLPTLQAESPMTFKLPEVSHKILRNLKKGQYNIDATLDLHGMTSEQAESALVASVLTCLEHGDRVLLIVHGKSRHQETPVIKNRLNHWLRQIEGVLAFCTAATQHGGTGAIYVLLRKA